MDPRLKIELSHDLLARQIERRLTTEERNRRRAERMLRDGLARHREMQQQGDNRWLAEEDIVFVRSFGRQLDLEDAEWQYLADSNAARRAEAEAEKKALEAQAEQERRLRENAEQSENKARTRYRLAIVGIVAAILLASLAFWQYNDADSAKKEALASQGKALAAAERDSISRVKADSALVEARAAGKRDSLSKVKADSALVEAETARETALAAQSETQRQLEKVLAANSERVNALLRNLREVINDLDFAKAQAIVSEALALQVNPKASLPAAAELVFFYTEAGKPGPAFEIVEQARPLIPGLPSLKTPDTLAYCREAFERMAVGDIRERIAARYYPVMVEVEGGTFWMGDEEYFDYTEHQVAVYDYELARTELTVLQYHLFLTAIDLVSPDPPSWGWKGDHPMIYLNWYDAAIYCNWLSEKRGLRPAYYISQEEQDPNNLSDYDDLKWLVELDTLANGFRLPTEAEWEFAAGGGNLGRENGKRKHIYAGSDNLDLVGWYDDNVLISSTQSVASSKLSPNELGLYDMSGNVWEWCFDWYDSDYYLTCKSQGNVSNPRGPNTGSVRVYRGGSWYGFAEYCRVADRGYYFPVNRYDYLGVRPARTP